ncbi:hypothetical protein [Caenispirillum bisanense]|uniref:hypothetical protein n=1 Tax=Caenispirillum bisanense TaxID=414052 RepID=UPI001144607A|nr:hypothetical protein [Caenispirillum bisanense]
MAGVMVSLLPAIAFDPEIAGDGPWEAGGVVFDANPRDLVDFEAAEVVAAWRNTAIWYYPPMGGAPRITGHTPLEAGGYYEQPAVVLDYFSIMDSFANAIMAEEASRK